jgi:hypothetical protein
MSQSTTVADSILELAGLVRAGDRAEAKRQARTLLDTADPRHLTIVAQCATILDYWPRIGVAKLRAYWQSCTDPQDRAIIAACAPEPGEHPQRTQPNSAPRGNTSRHQARRTVRRQMRPELRRRRDQRQQREEPAVVTAYHQDRAGVDDAPEYGERPDGYAVDYDRAAVPALRGTPCVYCWVERSSADQAPSRADDGLCEQCRDKGRPGIPALPAGHTRADAIAARCALIAAKHHRTAAVSILRNEWDRAQGRDRAVIAEWVAAHRAEIDGPAASTLALVGKANATCGTCGSVRQVRAGQCADCRALAPEPDPAGPAAAAAAPEPVAAAA